MARTLQEKPLNRADEVKDVSAPEEHSDHVRKHLELTLFLSPVITSSHTNRNPGISYGDAC
jgi:hypothetical protein